MCLRIITSVVAAASVGPGSPGGLAFEMAVLYPHESGVIAVETADVDGDGHWDVIVCNFGHADGGFVSVMRGRGDGTLGPPETYAAGSIHLALVLADLNADGAPDIALANFDDGSVSVLLNQGDGTYGVGLDYPAVVSIPRGIAAGDLDGDGDHDLVVGDVFSELHAVLLNDGAGAFSTGETFAGGATTIDAKVADLDGDGDLDAVFAFSDLSWHRNDGTGHFEHFTVIDTGQFAAVTLADFDDDGDIDIAAAKSGQLIVYLNTGAGDSFVSTSHEIPALTRDVATDDFDGDGHLDLVTAHVAEINRVAVLRNLGTGAFEAAVEFEPGAYPQSVSTADLDEDGRSDIVTALEFEDPPSVSVLISESTAAPPGDLDGDGTVGITDLLALLVSWGPCPAPPAACAADLDGGGSVGLPDLLILLSNWG